MSFAPNPQYRPKVTNPADRGRIIGSLLSRVSGKMDAEARSLGCKTKQDFANWARSCAQRQ
jgi:hypothetical protein